MFVWSILNNTIVDTCSFKFPVSNLRRKQLLIIIFLFIQTADDYSAELFPKASKAHWKMLLLEVEQAKKVRSQPARRLQSGGKYLGLNIAMDNAIISFGS